VFGPLLFVVAAGSSSLNLVEAPICPYNVG